MKRLLLSLIVLTHSLSVHASEQQSWFSRNLGIIAGASAAATGALAGVALWQWNKTSTRKTVYNKAVVDQPVLSAEQKELDAVLQSNDKMLECHMNHQQFQIDHHVDELRKKKIKSVNIEPHLKEHEKARVGHQSLTQFCTSCSLRYSSDAGSYSRRKTACELTTNAHNGLQTAVKARKDVVDKELNAASTTIANDVRTDFDSTLRRFKRIGYTSAAVSLASLGALWWNKK
jgi:coenzyme F420-reducing hydrogenase delta subunit